jgi:fibronectin-binding autotransporter adhesin
MRRSICARRWRLLAALVLLAGLTESLHAATDTWTGAINNNWGTTSPGTNWNTTNIPAIPINGDTLVYDGPGGTSNNETATINSLGGITFAANAGPYVLTGATPITLTGPLTVVSGNSNVQEVDFQLLGSANLLVGAGTTGGNNLTLRANDTFGGMTVASSSPTASPTANILDIGSTTLSVNGNVAIGAAPGAGNIHAYTTLNVVGAGSWNVVNNAAAGSFKVGVGANANGNGSSAAVLDLSGLANFSFSSTGATSVFGVGANVTRPADSMILANTSNSITANSVIIGDSNQGAGDNNNGLGITNTLSLGAGTNAINANVISIGNRKSAGSMKFAGPSGSVVIKGQAGGASNADITIGQFNAGTGSTPSSLLLANNNTTSAIVQAGTVTVGFQNGNTAAVANGSITFDTGTFDVNSLRLAVDAGGASTVGAVGSFTLGTDATSTGVLTVRTGGSFFLANNTNTTSGPANGTFTINGGTANINANITVPSTRGTGSTTLNLYGGLLDMKGFAIGGSGAVNSGNGPVTNVNLVTTGGTATLQNLGAGGINGAGLTMNGSGTLILGNNTYSGVTTLSGGTLQLNSANSLGSSSLNANGGAIAFAPAIGTFNAGGLSGSSGINLSDTNSGPATLKINGAGGNYQGQLTGNGGLIVQGTAGTTLQTLAGAHTYSGTTAVTAGTLQLQNAQLYSGVVSPGTTTVNGGVLSGIGQINSPVALSSGSIVPDAVGSPLEFKSFSMTGGTLAFNLNGSTISNLLIDNAALMSGGSLSFSATLPVPSTYTLLTALTLNHTGFALSDVTIGASTFHPFFSGNTLQVTITGAPSSLNWVGANSAGAWDLQTTKNWNNTSTGINPDFFHNQDSVQFDDSSTHNTVNITGPVQPTAVTFTNSNAHNYIVNSSNGNGIGGPTTLTMNSTSGNGSVTLNTANTYTGNTIVQSGTLIVGSTGKIASANSQVSGGTLSVSSGGMLGSTAIDVSGSGVLSVAAGGLLTGTSPTVTVNNTSGNGFTVAAGATLPATLNLVNNGTTTLSSSQAIATLNGTASTAVVHTAGALTVNSGGTYAGAISDGGGLTVGGGTLVLTGANNYSGATTVNSGATLQIDDGLANTGAISGGTAITNNGTLILARNDSPPAFANTITGTGVVRIGGNTALTGTVTLSGNNSHSGGTSVYSGTLIQGSPNALGGPTGAIVLGTPQVAAGTTGTTPGNLTLAFNTTAGSFSSTDAAVGAPATADVLTIPTGVTFTVNGPFTVGAINTTTNATVYNAALNVTGGGSLIVAGTGAFNAGQPSQNTGGKDTTTVDLSGLSSVNVNTTANFNVGFGANSRGILTLADNTATGIPTNFVNAAAINVGNSAADNNAGLSTLNLGSGTNTLQASTINIGLGKTGGAVTWVADATPASSVTIAGTGGGTAVANIIVSGQNSATAGGVASSLLLAGHIANVQVGSLAIGQNIGNTAGAANGTVTFDTGVFNAQSVSIAAATSGSSPTGPTGNLTIGGATPNTTATGVFNVSSSFVLGNVAINPTTLPTATANFTINGGTANIASNITVPSTFGTTTSTLTLAGGGVLNMAGHSIGGTGISGDNFVTNVSLAPNGGDTPTLMNLGGAGINAAGLAMNGFGTLTLDGVNSYTGGTAINTGILQVGRSTSPVLASPLGASSGTATVNSGASLNFASNNAMTIANPIAGSGQINQQGNGVTTLTGTSSFNGQTSVTAGTLAVNGVLNNSGPPGSLTVGGGTLSGAGSTGADVILNTGVIAPSPTGTALTANSLIVNSGTIRFNVDGANIGKIASSGFANLNSGQLSFGLISAPTQTSYTILTSTSLSNSLSLAPVSAGRTTFTPSVSGNNLVVNVTGGPATVTWNNSVGGGNGTDWDVVDQRNWTSTAPSDPNRFYQFDNVLFSDSNNGKYTVNVNGTLTPLSVSVTTANTYTFQGTGSISGTTGLTISGNGTVNLGNTGGNSYTGPTNINSGTLRLVAANALPNAANVTVGGTLDLVGNSVSLASLAGAGTIGSSSTASDASITIIGPTANTFTGSINDVVGAGNKKAALTLSAGSLLLTGANNYTGATTIDSTTTLQVGNGGATGSLSATTPIVNNGNLIYNLSSSPVLANNISGYGQVTQSGAGTLILTGANSYGQTVVNSGTVQVGNDGATGSLGLGAVTNNGALNFKLTANYTVGGTISGTGTLTQSGTGTVSLTANNNFSGGVTVASGSLQVNGTGGFTGLGTGNTTIEAGATLIGANADSLGFNGGTTSPLLININGGTVTNLGNASYRITLPNLSFTGGTLTSAAGNLGDANGQFSLQGPQGGPSSVTTNAASTTAVISAPIVSIQNALTFNVASGSVVGGTTPGVDLLVSSSLRSFGATTNPFIKTGSGVMQLTGANTYTGTTAVTAGTLLVNGTHTGGGNYTVASTATLGGSGTIGSAISVDAGGFLSPGAGIGILHATGTVNLSGTLNTELLGSGHDLLDATGPLNLVAGAAANFTLLGNITKTSYIFANYPAAGLTGSFGSPTFALGQGVSNVPLPTGAAITNDAVNHQLVLTVSPQSLRGNFNLDGTVDNADIGAMLKALTDLNGYVNGGNSLHVNLSNGDLLALGDFDGSGTITNRDIQPMLAYIGGLAGSGSLSSVPEPASWLLLAVGGAFALARRSRFGRRKS